MKLTAKNFQPWEQFSLDIDGLTLIVGASNKGKSSIFRGLKGVIRNDLPPDFVRNGQAGPLEMSLTVDGQDIKATRTRKGSSKYTVNDKPYAALGGDIPEVMKDLKLGEVKVGDVTIDPIFSEQNRAQFLIDPQVWKPSDINSVLGAFSSTEKLDAGKKEANSRITQKNSEAKTLAEEIREAEERKSQLETFTDESSGLLSFIDSFDFRVKHYESQAASIQEARQRMRKRAIIKDVLGSLSIPNVSGAEQLERKARAFAQARVHFVRTEMLASIEVALNSALATWETTAKTFKRRQALLALRDILTKQGMSPKDCADRLEVLISTANLVLSSDTTLLSIVDGLNKVSNLREKIKAKESELSALEVEHKTALDDVTNCQKAVEVKALAVAKSRDIPRCPRCSKALVCPDCGNNP